MRAAAITAPSKCVQPSRRSLTNARHWAAELDLPTPLGERPEEPRLGRHGLVDAELVDEAQAALDVAVGAARVAAEVVDHAEHVLDAARREPVPTPPGERGGGGDRGSCPIGLAEDDGEDGVGDPDDG